MTRLLPGLRVFRRRRALSTCARRGHRARTTRLGLGVEIGCAGSPRAIRCPGRSAGWLRRVQQHRQHCRHPDHKGRQHFLVESCDRTLHSPPPARPLFRQPSRVERPRRETLRGLGRRKTEFDLHRGVSRGLFEAFADAFGHGSRRARNSTWVAWGKWQRGTPFPRSEGRTQGDPTWSRKVALVNTWRTTNSTSATSSGHNLSSTGWEDASVPSSGCQTSTSEIVTPDSIVPCGWRPGC